MLDAGGVSAPLAATLALSC